VRHEEDSRSAVEGADSRSFITKNPDGVALPLQILTNVVRGKGEDSRYVFSDNPSRSNFPDQPRKFRPEVAVVVFPFFGAGNRKWLTGKTSVDDVNRSNLITSQCFDVVVDGNIRPVPAEYRPAKFVALAHGGDPSSRRFKSQVYPANSCEKRQARHDFSSSSAGCSVS
jgi:hypothetical protein